MRNLAILGIFATLGILASGCSDNSSDASSQEEPEISSEVEDESSSSIESSVSEDNLPDYSRAIEMNKAIGHGVNLGNAWDGRCYNVGDCLDAGWHNPIDDEYFKIIKEAGFTSIRLPVRWNQTASNTAPYTLSEDRVKGVKEDIQIANSLGLIVVLNMHHYDEFYSDPDGQKEKFYAMWEQIAEEFKDFSNDSLLFEVLNESREKSDKQIAEWTNKAIEIIRKSNPDRTILVNPGNWGKFELMGDLKLPKDGNIIIDGHYYEPFGYSHQGHNGDCGVLWPENDMAKQKTIVKDLKSYIAMAKAYYPGKNGTHIPLSIGEFGASSRCEAEGVNDQNRSYYISDIVSIANELGYSWQIWGFTGVGFDIYNKSTETWYPKILKALQDNM